MKKIAKLLFIIVFMLICIIPVFTMALFSEDESTEKRELSEKPVLISENSINMDYTSQLNTYLSEHFSFRSDLVTLWGVIQAEFFGTSTQEKVVVGKDNWLFFSDTLDDYTGRNVFDKYEVSSIVKTMDLINEVVTENGGKFIFVVAPNKNTVYSQYMPYYCVEADTAGNFDLLNVALKDKTYYVNVLDKLKNSTEQTYHKRDSHWNNLGAQICFSEVMKKTGFESVDYSKVSYSKECIWRGDLDDMIFPKLNYLDEQVVYDTKFEYSYISSFHSEEDINIKTFNENGKGKLIMYRDSFANALIPFFSSTYQTADYTRVQPFRFNALVLGNYDTYVVEMAERNLPELLKSAPLMPAPERENKGMTVVSDAKVQSRAFLGFTHVYGVLAEQSDCTEIYLKVTVDGESKVYEAFPIYEKELIEGENAKEQKSRGFSAFLPFIENTDNVKIEVLKKGE